MSTSWYANRWIGRGALALTVVAAALSPSCNCPSPNLDWPAAALMLLAGAVGWGWSLSAAGEVAARSASLARGLSGAYLSRGLMAVLLVGAAPPVAAGYGVDVVLWRGHGALLAGRSPLLTPLIDPTTAAMCTGGLLYVASLAVVVVRRRGAEASPVRPSGATPRS